MQPLVRTLRALGARLETDDGNLPIEIWGQSIEGGAASIEPAVSSQFVSSVVLAAPLMRKGLDLEILGDLPSAPYLDLTEDVLRGFGGKVKVEAGRRWWRVAPGGLHVARYEVEGDWSAAAFVLAAAAVAGGEVEMGALDADSRQGDRAVVEILSAAGLETEWRGHTLAVRGPITAPISADLHDTPDLFPALIVAAAAGPPGSRFRGLENLRHKESDRLTVMVRNLSTLGAEIAVAKDEVEVRARMRRAPENPPTLTAAGDHRVAMAVALAALAVGRLKLDDPDCVSKSFPGFWRAWERLVGPGEG
jgi:3-phosphoshikimate 1-carboxyvinyltransferase